MKMKKTVSRITSIAILSASLISFIPINSYGVTYYSSDNNNSYNPYTTNYTATNSTVTRYYSSNNSNTSNLSYSTPVESNTSQSNSQTTSNRTTYYSSNNNTSQYSTQNYQRYRTSSSGAVTRYYSKNTNYVSNTQDTSNSNTTETSNSNTNSTSTDNISASFKADAETQKMLSLINEERNKKGLNPLVLHEKLTSVAELKAKDMVENDYLSHTSATYGSIYTMIKNAGISYYNAGENIARAFSIENAHNNFMNSYMHKKAILADHFTHVGIGIERESGGMYKISVMFIEEK